MLNHLSAPGGCHDTRVWWDRTLGEMEWMSWLGVLLAVLVGSYVQAVAGFAMGLIIVAVVGGLRLLDVPTLSAVISLPSTLLPGGM